MPLIRQPLSAFSRFLEDERGWYVDCVEACLCRADCYMALRSRKQLCRVYSKVFSMHRQLLRLVAVLHGIFRKNRN